MNITLRAGERIYINGAVLRVDRKATLELMNDATFLLETHVMKAEDATTPLRQIYFVVQVMLMDPTSARNTSQLAASLIDKAREAFEVVADPARTRQHSRSHRPRALFRGDEGASPHVSARTGGDVPRRRGADPARRLNRSQI